MVFPEEFDAEYYRHNNKDLADFTRDRLWQHYCRHGIHEGRAGSPAARREGFVPFIDTRSPVLEIGPFFAPLLRGDHVFYFDIMDQEGLGARAVSIGRSEQPPYIHYVSADGDLSVVDRRFGSIISAHCIEHTPDLIRHLQQVSNILLEGGHYFLVVPDKRYCFDHFMPESTIADVLEAHEERRTTHRLASLVEHYALTTHNDPARHWSGDHMIDNYECRIAPRAGAAVQKFRSSIDKYIDVHAWQFTPESFRGLIRVLREMELTSLNPVRIYQTPRNRFEFTAILAQQAAP